MAMAHSHHTLQSGVSKFDSELKCPVRSSKVFSYRETRDRLPPIADITVTYAQSTIQDRESTIVKTTTSKSECDSSESRECLSEPRVTLTPPFMESSSPKVTSTLPNFASYPRERLDAARPQFDDSQFQRPHSAVNMRVGSGCRRAEVEDNTFKCPSDRFEENRDRRLLNVALPSVSTFQTPPRHGYLVSRRDDSKLEPHSGLVKRELSSPAPVINSSDSTCFSSPPLLTLQEPSPRLDSTQYSSIGYSRSPYAQNPYSAPASVYSPPPSPGCNQSFPRKASECNTECGPSPAQSHPGYADYSYPATPNTPDHTAFYSSRCQSSTTNNYDSSSEILVTGAGPPSQRFCERKTQETGQGSSACSSASRSVVPSSTSEDLDPPVHCSEKGRGNLYAVIDKVIIEFDGTTLLCRVCGDRSSGFHYGVHSCEGCKGFFRRSIQQKIQYRPCSKNQQCLVQKTNRNRCQYCRLKKCIEVGMSKDAVRFGRVPKNEKERIRQAMEKASNNIPQQDYNDDFLIQSITRSHLQSSAVANENMREIIRTSEENPQVANIDPISDCPLNPYVGTEDFQQKFSPIVRDVVAFAKNIPGFSDIKHDDKITLLRACVFEVLLIRFARLIDAKNRRMITISGYIINASIYANIKTSNDFFNTLFTFVDRINTLKLSDEEMALFSAAIVINPKRQGLHELSKVSSLHKRIVQCLHVIMQRERPNDPSLCQDLLSTLNDLWILNGMHSKQTQAKQKGANSDCDARMDVSGPQTEGFGTQYPCYSDYPEVRGCPMRYSNSSEYDEKRAPMEEQTSQTSPTSPSSSTFCPDEEMRSPGSADSGCSTDSGCSIESGCSSDSGCSMNIASNDHGRSTMLSDEPRETMSVPDDETTERFRKCYIKRKPNVEDSRTHLEKGRPVTWHKPQKESEKLSDSPVLRMCLEAPSTLKMDSFKDVYRGHSAHSHPHKKFRPTVDRSGHPHETLDYSHSSPRPSTTPSPSYSSSPSPSSSISSSPSRISSSPYSSSSSSNPSSPANVSILAHRLAMPCKKFPKTSSLLQSLSQESKFGTGKALVSDTLHDCIMNDQSKIPRQHVLATASPSRYDCGRNSSPLRSQTYMSSPTHSMTTSPPPHDDVPPHSYSSPIPVAHSSPSHTPTGLGASAMSGCTFSSSYICDNAEPLNLSTKTPSPPPAMET